MMESSRIEFERVRETSQKATRLQRYVGRMIRARKYESDVFLQAGLPTCWKTLEDRETERTKRDGVRPGSGNVLKRGSSNGNGEGGDEVGDRRRR